MKGPWTQDAALVFLAVLTIVGGCRVDSPTPPRELLLRAAVATELDAFAAELAAERPADAAGYVGRLRTYIEAFPEVYGSAAALFDDAGTIFASPYVYRTTDGIRALDLVKPDYAIETQDWITMPLAKGVATWTQRHFDAGGEIWMVTRSVPIRDAHGVFAVVTTDLAVDEPDPSSASSPLQKADRTLATFPDGANFPGAF